MKTACSTQKTSRLYRGSTFLQYHKDIPGESNPAGAKTALGGTQVNPLVLRKGNEVAQT